MQSSGTTSRLLKKVQPLTRCLGRTGTRQTRLHTRTHTHHPHTHAYMFIAEDNMQHKQENKVVNIWCATTPWGIPVIYAGFSKDCREAFNGLSLSGLFVSGGIEWCMKTLELDCWRCNMNSRMRVEYPALGCYSKLLRVSSLKLLRTCTCTVLFPWWDRVW